MKRHLKKQFLRILNYTLLFMALILLLIFLFGFLDDLMNKLDILIKHSSQQANQIHILENEINSLETANARLENVVTYQHEQLQELRVQGNTMSFTMQPKEVTMEDLHNEIEPQLHTSVKDTLINPQTIAVTVMTALSMLRGFGALVLP
jgi:Cu/Ag efflux protein CusF